MRMMVARAQDLPPAFREFLALVVGLALAVCGVNWMLEIVDRCPLSSGDQVVNGDVIHRQMSGSLTEACVVQVQWADGSVSYVAARSLEQE